MQSRRILAVVTAAVICQAPSSLLGAQGSAGDVRLMAVAKYVALGYDLGDRWGSEFDPTALRSITQNDRQAYLDLRAQFEKWHRYVLIDRPADAELLIGVRVGRRVSVDGANPAGGPPPAGSFALSAGVEVSSARDMLTVRDRGGSVLWRQQLADGFAGPSVPLFERLRSAIDAAAKRP